MRLWPLRGDGNKQRRQKLEVEPKRFGSSRDERGLIGGEVVKSLGMPSFVVPPWVVVGKYRGLSSLFVSGTTLASQNEPKMSPMIPKGS